MRNTFRLTFFCFLLTSPAAAQTTMTIESGGSDIVLTLWTSEPNPETTVLLLPGWGGGPTDVLGIGRALSAEGIPVVVLTPRGWHASEGTASFANAIEDIAAAWSWVRNYSRDELNPDNVVLGGHSWGGGMALAYAAGDTTVRRVFSIAGTDHGLFIRRYAVDSSYRAMVDEILTSTRAPNGPIRFDVESAMREIEEGQDVFGLIEENAGRLADRSILLVGGWEDVNVTIDDTLLPLYRALRGEGGRDVTFLTYHAGHGFGTVRERLHRDLLGWITHE